MTRGGSVAPLYGIQYLILRRALYMHALLNSAGLQLHGSNHVWDSAFLAPSPRPQLKVRGI